MNPLSPMETAESLKSMIDAVDAPFVKSYISTLGGKDRPSVMVTISFDPRGTWANGILENSRYTKMSFNIDGRTGVNDAEYVSGSEKFRKFKFATPADAMTKLRKWLAAR